MDALTDIFNAFINYANTPLINIPLWTMSVAAVFWVHDSWHYRKIRH